MAELIDVAQERVQGLDPNGPIRAELTDDYFNSARDRLARLGASTFSFWAPGLLHVARSTVAQLRILDADLTAVQERNPPSGRGLAHLACEPPVDGSPGDEDRTWSSHQVEVALKARALRAESANPSTVHVEFDVTLPAPSRRNTDIVLTRGDRHFHIEITTLSDSDIDRECYNATPHAARAGDLQGNSKRIYHRVFAKLAKTTEDPQTHTRTADPEQTQMSLDRPNVLALAFTTYCSPLSPASMETDWTLNGLFGLQPPSPSEPYSLLWYLTNGGYPNVTKLMGLPKLLGAVMTFGGTGLHETRRNPNASAANGVTPEEIAWLEEVSSIPLGWESPEFESKQLARLNAALAQFAASSRTP